MSKNELNAWYETFLKNEELEKIARAAGQPWFNHQWMAVNYSEYKIQDGK